MKPKKKKFHWQQNFRKIPAVILAKVNNFAKDDVIIAGVKRISESDILAGKYQHLGITLEANRLTFPNSFLPNVKVGTYSRINIEGKEIIRKDLPKTTKTVFIETPNFGDWSRGSHTVGIPRQVYQRDLITPKELEIKIELLREEVSAEKNFVFKFSVDIVLNRKHNDLKSDLLYSLNLLQENVGVANVFHNNSDLGEYLKTINVNWEIFPLGDRDNVVSRILSGYKTPTKEIREKILKRYNLLTSLKPIAFISGTNGFRRYFGAKFSEKLVVFENLEYGNALYVMFEEWNVLSKLSRLELLSRKKEGFVRIIHKSGWEIELKQLVKKSS